MTNDEEEFSDVENLLGTFVVFAIAGYSALRIWNRYKANKEVGKIIPKTKKPSRKKKGYSIDELLPKVDVDDTVYYNVTLMTPWGMPIQVTYDPLQWEMICQLSIADEKSIPEIILEILGDSYRTEDGL